MDEATAKDHYITAGLALYAQINHADYITRLLSEDDGSADSKIGEEALLRMHDTRNRLEEIYVLLEILLEPHFENQLESWDDEALRMARAGCEEINKVVAGNEESDDDLPSASSLGNKQQCPPKSNSSIGNQHGEQEGQQKKRKAPSKSAQRPINNGQGKVAATIEGRNAVLDDARNVVQGVPQSLSNYSLVAVNLRLAEIAISQVKDAYNHVEPRLSRIKLIARNLFSIHQSQSAWKKKILVAHACLDEKGKAVDISDDYGNLGSASTVGDILLRMENNITTRETAMKREVPTDIKAALLELQSAINRLNTGSNKEVDTSKPLTKGEISKMKLLLNFDHAIENLLLNLFNLSMMISFEGASSISKIATFTIDKKMTKQKQAEVRAASTKYLSSFAELWSKMNPAPFDGHTTTLLEFREGFVLPALVSKDKDTKELAVEVNRNMMALFTTEMRRKGQKEKMLPLVKSAQSETLDGSEGTCEVDYCGESKQDDRRRRMGCLQHNLSASDAIEEHLPASLYPNGMTHKLLINAPSKISTGCNFQNESKGFFERVHDDQSSIVVQMKKYMKDHNVGEKTIFVDEALVESLNQLLGI